MDGADKDTERQTSRTVITDKPAELTHQEVMRALKTILKVPSSDPSGLESAASKLYDILREDASVVDDVFEPLREVDIMALMLGLLEDTHRRSGDLTNHYLTFILSALISRAPSQQFTSEDVKYFAGGLIKGDKYDLTELARLDSMVNLLKIDAHRKTIWDIPGSKELLHRSLENSFSASTANVPTSFSMSISVTYRACFALWLYSFNPTFVSKLTVDGFTLQLCQIIKEARVEKIIRVCLHALKNLVKDDDAAEVFIEEDVFQTLTLLEYEKWKDLEMYEDIRDAIYQLDQKVKHFSNFDRYCLELDKGILKWSVLHSEKFWHENVMSFEQDEFLAVRKLARLLDSSNRTTIAVAAYDLGEFARLHPAGKKVCHKLRVKDKVMLLISSRDRAVTREALLCVQKLMLKNWQAVQSSK